MLNTLMPNPNNPFNHGPVKVSPGGSYLQHADGTPFFYLADTAWNGPLLSSEAEWDAYLRDRASKRFTAIQFIVLAPWAGAYTNAEGQAAFSTSGGFKINDGFFRRIDARIDAINAVGLLAVPVLLWAANFGDSGKYNPGHCLQEPQLLALAQYMVDRYANRQVMWILAGDGRYAWLRARKWKRIGRAVFGNKPHAPVAMHPMGGHWPMRSFRSETWLDIAGYQTSHSDDHRTLRFLHRGRMAEEWSRKPIRPMINLEPCYEGIRNFAPGATQPIGAAEVRKAVYASLLNAPTAGVAYGAHGVWSWEQTAREPLNHPGCGIAQPWREAMALPGSDDMRRAAELFASIEWWRLRPAPEMLTNQPGDADLSRFISAAKTDDGRAAIIYLPAGGEIALDPAVFRFDNQISWFNPRTGERTTANPQDHRYCAPDQHDWILVGF